MSAPSTVIPEHVSVSVAPAAQTSSVAQSHQSTIDEITVGSFTLKLSPLFSTVMVNPANELQSEIASQNLPTVADILQIVMPLVRQQQTLELIQQAVFERFQPHQRVFASTVALTVHHVAHENISFDSPTKTASTSSASLDQSTTVSSVPVSQQQAVSSTAISGDETTAVNSANSTRDRPMGKRRQQLEQFLSKSTSTSSAKSNSQIHELSPFMQHAPDSDLDFD